VTFSGLKICTCSHSPPE